MVTNLSITFSVEIDITINRCFYYCNWKWKTNAHHIYLQQLLMENCKRSRCTNLLNKTLIYDLWLLLRLVAKHYFLVSPPVLLKEDIESFFFWTETGTYDYVRFQNYVGFYKT